MHEAEGDDPVDVCEGNGKHGKGRGKREARTARTRTSTTTRTRTQSKVGTVESAVTTRRIVRARRIRPTKVVHGEKEPKKSTTDAPVN